MVWKPLHALALVSGSFALLACSAREGSVADDDVVSSAPDEVDLADAAEALARCPSILAYDPQKAPSYDQSESARRCFNAASEMAFAAFSEPIRIELRQALGGPMQQLKALCKGALEASGMAEQICSVGMDEALARLLVHVGALGAQSVVEADVPNYFGAARTCASSFDRRASDRKRAFLEFDRCNNNEALSFLGVRSSAFDPAAIRYGFSSEDGFFGNIPFRTCATLAKAKELRDDQRAACYAYGNSLVLYSAMQAVYVPRVAE